MGSTDESFSNTFDAVKWWSSIARQLTNLSADGSQEYSWEVVMVPTERIVGTAEGVYLVRSIWRARCIPFHENNQISVGSTPIRQSRPSVASTDPFGDIGFGGACSIDAGGSLSACHCEVPHRTRRSREVRTHCKLLGV